MSLSDAGYLALAISLALSIFYRGTIFPTIFAYLALYEALYWCLDFLGKYYDTPYMSLAIVIDSAFFYLFIRAGSRTIALLSAFSAIFGAATLSALLLDYPALDNAYGVVGVAISYAMLIAGIQSGLHHRRSLSFGGRHFSDSTNAGLDKSQKEAKN